MRWDPWYSYVLCSLEPEHEIGLSNLDQDEPSINHIFKKIDLFHLEETVTLRHGNSDTTRTAK